MTPVVLQADGGVLPMILGNWEFIVGFLGVFLLAYWVFDERDQTSTISETVERVGERSRKATGGVVGAAGSLAVVVIATVSTVGNELIMSGMRIAEIVGTDPVLSGGVALGSLGTLSVGGWLTIKTWQFAALAAFLLVAGTIWRERTQA